VDKDPGDHAKDPTTGVAPTNYGVNCAITMPCYWRSLGGKWGNYPVGPVGLGQINNPAAVFIWEDWGQAYTDGAIHNRGTNFACCDGHAKWIRQGQKAIFGGWM
jgi:prepilin-type processing-associated H-X9-DG protein